MQWRVWAHIQNFWVCILFISNGFAHTDERSNIQQYENFRKKQVGIILFF